MFANQWKGDVRGLVPVSSTVKSNMQIYNSMPFCHSYLLIYILWNYVKISESVLESGEHRWILRERVEVEPSFHHVERLYRQSFLNHD